EKPITPGWVSAVPSMPQLTAKLRACVNVFEKGPACPKTPTPVPDTPPTPVAAGAAPKTPELVSKLATVGSPDPGAGVPSSIIPKTPRCEPSPHTPIWRGKFAGPPGMAHPRMPVVTLPPPIALKFESVAIDILSDALRVLRVKTGKYIE